MTAWVYIVTNCRNGTLYIGMTSDLPRRSFDHRRGVGSEFTQKYGLHRLVYYVEAHPTMPLAIAAGEAIEGVESRLESAVDQSR